MVLTHSKKPVCVSPRSVHDAGLQAGTRSTKQFAGITQQKRLRVAGITVVAFICMLLLLGLQERLDKKAQTTAGPVAQYTNDYSTGGDPLCLVGRVATLELVGVSDDGLVIGYASDLDARLCVMHITGALRADGWILFDDNQEGLLSFYRVTKSETESSTLFIQCIAVGHGSSIVVNRW